VIERHVTFRLLPGRAQALAEFFRAEYGPALARQPGFHGAELLEPEEIPDTVVLLLRFRDGDAARGWRESADHRALSPRLKSMVEHSEVRVHQVLARQPAPVGSL
jgi:heme-degrading monooxygenase HmoA